MAYSAQFLEFWETYPRRKNDSKSKALEKWNKLKLDDIADEVMSAIKKYRGYKEVKQGYNKGAVVWLNQRMWETINEEESVPFLSTTTMSSADEQETKVIQNVINPLISFYGDPDWYSKGKDANRIIMKWAGLLSCFSITAMKKGVDDVIVERAYQNYPSLSEVYRHINKYKYVDNGDSHRFDTDANNWYEQNFLNLEEQGPFNMTSRYKALFGCFDMVKNIERQYDNTFAELLDKAWSHGFIQGNFERLCKDCDEALLDSTRYKKGRSMLKGVYLAAKNKFRREL